jgi:hypothetical protein
VSKLFFTLILRLVVSPLLTTEFVIDALNSDVEIPVVPNAP